MLLLLLQLSMQIDTDTVMLRGLWALVINLMPLHFDYRKRFVEDIGKATREITEEVGIRCSEYFTGQWMYHYDVGHNGIMCS